MSSMTILELLNWAFVHELPKGGGHDGLVGRGSAWSMINGFAELGTKAQTSMPVDWTPPFILEQGDPHPDAVVIGKAVADLGALDIVIPLGWSPIEDWVSDEARELAQPIVAAVVDRVRKQGRAVRASGVQALIVCHAALGRRPDHTCDEPGLRHIMRSGRPAWFVVRSVAGSVQGQDHEVEVDGWDKRKGRPHPGAYRKRELTDDPRPGIMARLDWQVWVSAIQRIEAAVIAAGLEDKKLRPVILSPEPWCEAGGAPVHLA